MKISTEKFHSVSTWSFATAIVCLALLLCSPLLLAKQSRSQGVGGVNARGGRFSGVSHVLPAMGQSRPVFVSGNLAALMADLEIDPSNGPVIEMILAQYQDAFQEAKSGYHFELSSLAPDTGDSEEVQARLKIAADELKRVRTEMQQRYRDGEWDGDERLMKQAVDQVQQPLVQRVLELQRAQEEAIDYTRMFSEYQAIFNRWLIRRAEIELEFEDQIKAFLDESQLANWERAKFHVLVSNELDRGLLAGERLNVEAVLDEVVEREEERALASELLERWRMEAGQILASRSVELMDVGRLYLVSGEASNPQGWVDAATQEARVRQVLRDHNLSYVQSIANVLSPESSLAFRENVYSDVLAPFYRNARIFRSIDAALQQRPLLESDKLESLERLRVEASEWMLDRVLEYEQALLEQDISQFVAGRRTEGQEFFRRGSVPITDWRAQSAESRQQIRDWDASIMQRLKDIIGNARYTRLPGARSAPSGNSGRGDRR